MAALPPTAVSIAATPATLKSLLPPVPAPLIDSTRAAAASGLSRVSCRSGSLAVGSGASSDSEETADDGSGAVETSAAL